MAEKEPDTEESTEANKEGGGGDGGARWPGPRTVLVARTENGFGFTLRHFIVYPPDPAGSEQGSEEGDPTDADGSDSGRRRKRTKLEPLDTIFVKHVKEGGPAQLSGLHTGDRIVSVNGHSVSGKSYSQVIGLIQQSDSSLKLLVVPRDEDVLQMAYQNSAYNHGQEPYRGSAGEIPEPPPATYGGSRGGSAGHRQTKPPLPPRYKSELKMVPEDDGLGRRTSGDGQPRWLGAHSSASSMGSSSSLGSSSHSKDPLDYRDPQALPSDVNGIGSGSAPGAPLRTSSKNIVLAHLQGGLDSGHRSGSVDSISRSSESSASTRRSADGGDGGGSSGHQPPLTSSMFLRRSEENVQHSSDNITGAADGGGLHLYGASRNGDRYRSSQEGVRHSREELPSAEELSGPSSAPPMLKSSAPPLLKSVTTSRLPAAISGYRPTPSTTYGRSQTTSALLNSSSGQRQPTTAKFSSATYIKPYKPILATSDARTSFSSSSSSSSSSDLKPKHSPAMVTRSGGDYRTTADQRDPWVPVSYDSGIQYSWPDVRKAEMSCGGPTVTVRIHDSGGGSGKPSPQRQRSGSQGAPTVTITAGRHSGSDRAINMVAERRKWFQSLDYPSSDQDRWGRLSGGSGGIDQRQQQSSPGGNTSTSITSTSPSPGMTEFRIEMSRGPPAPPHGVNDIVSNRIAVLEASSEDNISDGDTHRHRKLSSEEKDRGRRRGSSEDRHNRRSPHDDRQRRASREEQWKERERQLIPDRPASDQDEADGASGSPGVVLRQHSSPDEREAKLVRRTSYLMATNRDRGQPQAGAAAAAAAAAEQAEMSKSDSQLRQSPLSTSQMTTPTKTSNIRKLKAFFGEKTPRIVEATTNQQRCFDMPAASDIVKEGYLSCKMAISDGKRASDRSWKPMWAVLRGHALYMFKDKTSVSVTSPPVCDEQPISIKSSIVDIAYDYTKKKNVFRLTTYNGSEYLFQPDDHETMLDWIRVIQLHNNPDEDVSDKGVGNKELIVRKTVAYELASKTSPQPNVKSIKKTSTKSLRSKSPASHSPSSFKQQQLDSPKGKDSAEKIKGTWKGKMAKRFRRHGSTVATPAELNGTFGIPLELCCPGTFSEHVPLVVELCTRIVEARGIENQGIYRVPGNTGAVNSLQDQLNQDPENIDMDNDKWLDVNVISSLLKLFFRKLPEPLITDDQLYESIINANRMENSEKRMLHIKKILHELPDFNFETFRYIAGHLSNVASMGHVNKMDARNLAIVFGPTLVRSTDETLVTMVKDMSDQCRIVESIILNHDWFFGSWDMDMYVPHDEPAPDAVPVSGMNQELLSKAKHLDELNRAARQASELGERGRDISAKDMITSIIGAANKIRRRDKSSTRGERDGTVIEPESDSEPAYNERDIDREIELRGIKEQLAPKSSSLKDLPTSSQSLSSSHTDSTSTVLGESGSERDGMFTAKRVLIQRKDSETSATTTSSITSEETVPPRLNRYPAYPAPDLGISFSTENSKPVRRFSEDILSTSERRGDDEIDYRPYRGPRGMTYATQQHLRRIAMETQALRQKEEERRIEQERRAIDRQRIELELAKTKSELEREESIEDLIAKQNADLMTRIPDGSSKFSDYSSKADSTSIASDYSTTSSTAYGTDNKPHSLHMQLGYVSDYSSSTSPTSVHGEGMRQSGVHRPVPYGSNKGRYNGDDRTKQNAPSGKGFPHAQDDIELYRHHQPRPVFDVNKIATKGTLTRKKSKSPTRRQQDQAGSDEYGTSLRHSGSLQRTGSLDSLRDFYDKPESNPYLSESDNDDNLVESLTSTFDEKLKKLLDPKPRFDPATSKRTPPVGSESTQQISPNPRPLSHSTPTGSHATESPSRYEVSFQNPSLHRMRDGGGVGPHSDREPSPSGDPERRSSRNSGIDRWGAPTSLGLCRDLGDATSSSTSSPQHTLGSLVPEGANTSLRRWERENDDYAAQLRKSSERLYGSRERLLDVAPDPTGSLASAVGESNTERAPPLGEPSQPARPSGVKMRSASPPARRRASAAQKRVRRRHTVGGCSDYDHLAALAALNGQGPPPRSAWERLQPAVSPTEGEAKSIRDWCEKERLRAAGSSPAILSLTIQPAPAGRQPLQGAPALPPRDGTRAQHFQRSKSQPPGGSSQTSSTYSGGGSRGRPSFTFESSI